MHSDLHRCVWGGEVSQVSPPGTRGVFLSILNLLRCTLHAQCVAVSYTHLTLPTNREV